MASGVVTPEAIVVREAPRSTSTPRHTAVA